MSGDVVLAMRGLRVEAPGGAVLVDGIDLDLRAGEVLGLIGESGAGKSTIGLAALGYGRGGCRIAGGEITVAGTALVAGGRAAREKIRGARVAYVAQSAADAFNPAMRIERQVLEAPLRHGTMSRAALRAWMLELFRALDLPEPETFGRRFPHQVSGGQLQRAMIAMAMSCRPDVLVLDEPTTALDVTVQIEVLMLVKRLITRYRIAALYITHDLAVVAQVADRLMVLRGGRLVETAATGALLAAPASDYTRRLIAEREGSLVAQGVRHATGEPLLEVSGIVAAYGKARVLDDVSLRLARGETLAVVGESGSGKSTLARVLTGLLAPQAGSVRFAGTVLSPTFRRRPQDVLRRIQLVHQQPDVSLNPRQRVGEIVGRPAALSFGLRGAALRAEAERLLDLVGLPRDVAGRLPGALSGGQKQRVSIARALAARPDLVICDEVTSALDPLVAEDILMLLRRLQDELGVAYLFITHDLGLVRRLANRTMVMRQGRVVAAGPTPDIFRPPFDPYTAGLVASIPELRVGWLEDVMRRRAAPDAPQNP